MRVRKQFDHFELIEPIASGGMGTVYKARDLNLNRVVALKLLRREYSDDQEYIEKLETEAKITASVNHPHVVKVFSFGCDHGLYYIAMELVDKGSLDDLMNLQGKIAEVQMLEIGIQAAQGLRAAFLAGLIHRDVKPGNILFADAHTAKIVDFGLAMPLEQAAESEEEIWGTPYYVAPEKLNHDPEDFRSDIYSLGGTLFHALAGRPPFEAENASLVALKHLKNQVVSLQAFAPDISSPTAYVINRTLAKNPDERYQSYDELIEHLEYARTQLLENSGKRQPKARVVVETEEQRQVLSYVLLGVVAFTIAIAIVLYCFRGRILEQRKSVAEIEHERMEHASSEVEQNYEDARKRMLDGDIDSAINGFKQVVDDPNTSPLLQDWALLHLSIASYLQNHPSEGHGALSRLKSNNLFSNKKEDSALANFFIDLERLEKSPANQKSIDNYRRQDFQAIGLFLFGLSAWEGGRFDDAASFFKAYETSKPTGKYVWEADYKPFIKKYLSDYALAAPVREQIRNADTVDKKVEALKALTAIMSKLQVPGKLPESLAWSERALKAATKNAATTTAH
jgi:serine/threonine protein kinase